MSSPLLINSGLIYVGHAYKNTDTPRIVEDFFLFQLFTLGGIDQSRFSYSPAMVKVQSFFTCQPVRYIIGL